MASSDLDWDVDRTTEGAPPYQVAYECLSHALPHLRKLRKANAWTDRTAFEERLDGLVREAGKIDGLIERIFEERFVREELLQVRREAGERDPRPRVFLDAYETRKGNLAVLVTPFSDPVTGVSDIDTRPAVMDDYSFNHRPWFEIVFLRDFDRLARPISRHAKPNVDDYARAALANFALRAFQYAVAAIGRRAEVTLVGMVEAVEVEEGGLRHLDITTPESREARKEERRLAEEREAVAAEVAWVKSLPSDPMQIEATLAIAEAAGTLRKHRIAFLESVGIPTRYETLDENVARLRSALDAGFPGWRERKSKPQVSLDEPKAVKSVTKENAGRPAFDRTVELINEHRVAKGLAAIPLGRIPRTEQHLRRLAKQSGYDLKAARQ